MEHDNKFITRRAFLKRCATVTAGATVASLAGGVLFKKGQDDACVWQIDPQKCIFCGKCETDCVLRMSAVKCVHAKKVCGYCDLCGGYFRANVKDFNTGAENLMCPTGAIRRRFVEDPYFEYTIDEALCNGCGKCCKGCNSFGNGSLYLQIKRDLCKNCNECALERACPADAIKRVMAREAYILKA